MTRAQVIIDGDVGPLRRMLREGVSAMKQFGSDAEQQFEPVGRSVTAIARRFNALMAVIAAGAVFKEAIDDTVAFNKEVNGLARTLGISATEATAWNVALGDIYQDADSLSGAIGKLNQVIAEDEDKLNKLGIATRDASGQLKSQGDIFLAVTGHLDKFRVGTDRNVEGARLFGKSWQDVAPLLALTADNIEAARQKTADLGLTMTEESQGRVAAYRGAMNDVGDVLLGLKNVLAQAVMPVLTRMGEWFASVGPDAILAIRGPVNALSTAFMGLQNGVMVVWETIKAFVYTVAEPIRSLGEALFLLANGDFKGAADAMMSWTDRVGQRWSGTMAQIAEESRRTADDIVKLWGPGTAIQGAPDGSGGASAERRTKPGKAEPSQMDAFEGLLARQKQVLIEGGFIREYEAQQELAFWRQKLELANLSGADRLKIERKVSQLSYDIRRKQLDQERQLAELDRTTADAMAMERVENNRAAAKLLLDHEQMTKAQFLQLELQYEAERYQIQAQALSDRLALMASDPNSNPLEAARLRAEALRLEQDYIRQRMATLGDLGKEKGGLGNVFAGMETSFTSALAGMLSGTQTWVQALGGLFAGVRDTMIKNLVTEPVGNYIAGLGKMLAVKLGFLNQEQVAQEGATALAIGKKAAETTAVAGSNAVQAGTAAAASQAGIPVIGPMLALAAMAAVFAAVSGLGSRKSAARGYDIPTGVNPVTQLHEEEMVLPAKYANGLRDLIGSGQPGGQQGPTYNYHAAPGESPDSIRRNSRAYAHEMERLHRNGWRPSR